LALAEHIDAIVEMNHPGVWIFGSTNAEERSIGMGVVIEYAHATGTPQWQAPSKTVWN
jgi:hypothetical protein